MMTDALICHIPAFHSVGISMQTEARRSSGLSVPSGLPFLLAIVLGVVVATVVVSQNANTSNSIVEPGNPNSIVGPTPTPSAGQTDPQPSPPADVSGSASASLGAAL